MRQKPESCLSCPCYSHGTDFSRVDGQGSLGVMIVAEASGEFEQREGVPLVKWAPAGSVLQRTFTRMGLSREQFSLTNTLRCRPKNNWLSGAPWEFSALNHCRPNLDAAIAERRPRAILALGDTALRELTGEAGEARGVGHLCGYVLPTYQKVPEQCSESDCIITGKARPDCFICGGTGIQGEKNAPANNPIPVIPAYHPAFIRRGKAAYQGFFSRNLQRAINVASGKDREYIWDLEEGVRDGRIRYQVHPSLDEARSFAQRVKGNSGLVVSYDIETFESASLDEDARDGFTDTRIRLVQFSTESGSGIALPWEGAYREIAGEIIRTENVKCGHNIWIFDNRVLKATGEREGLDLNPRGTLHDTMCMFGHWQPDLPKHLQFCSQFTSFPFPWKHLAATDLEFYSCVDVDATLRLYNFLAPMLQRDQIWCGRWSPDGWNDGGYVGQVAQVRPVLAAMEDRGLPVDDVERLKLDGEFDLAQQELDTELQSRCPVEVLGLEPRRGKKGNYSYGYINAPSDLSGLSERTFDEAVVDDSGNPTMRRVVRWCRVMPFNANSSHQLLAYMRAKGHKVPKSRKAENEDGSPKDTTEKKELIRLAQRHSDTFYLKVIEYRELSKARGTYVDGFKPHEDGCVHTTFTFDTGIGQLSSRNPNIQNFIKHKRLAKATRRMIAAKENMILTEWDYKSCHVITLGFLAEDLNYIRLGRIDIHSFVAGHVLGLWDGFKIFSESDEELRVRFKWLKANPEWKHVRDDQAKHAILGIGNGLKEKGLFERYMEEFGNQKTAKRFLDICEGLFPNVFRWQERIQKRAHEQQFLRTEFGHIRRFYEVFRWDHKKGSWGHGDQGEQAISFWLSNIAFGHIRENMKAVHALGLAEKYGMCNNVHDSLMFHFPESLLPEHIHEIYPVLSMPSKVLKHPTIAPDGLWIDLDCSAGRNWSEMEEIALDRSKAGYVKKEAVNVQGTAGREYSNAEAVGH